MSKPLYLRQIEGPFSYDSYPSDGVQTEYTFSFVGLGKGYIEDSDIHVEWRDSTAKLPDGVTANPNYGRWAEYAGSFTLLSENSLRLMGGPVEATKDTQDNIRIRRIMPKDYPIADGKADDIFRSRTLNNLMLQTLYIQHELLDGFIDTRFAIGPIGPQGPMGPQGLQGERGPQGIQGVRGHQGVVGPQGPDGVKGETGSQGPRGPQGNTGPVGPIGPEGQRGAQGAPGLRGIEGPQGQIGPQGRVGDTGPTGPQGVQGPVGPQGPQGLTGIDGPRGPQGPMGPAGAQGPQGIQGPRGQFVTMIATLTPSELNAIPSASHSEGDGFQMTADGTLINGTQTLAVTTGDIVVWNLNDKWINLGPIRGPQGPQGEQGPRGEQGPTGMQGQRGEKGEVGDEGPIGPIGIQGPQGKTGDQGPVGPVGPQGPQGPRGEQGLPGDTGPVGPRGPEGIQGPEGIRGPQGFEGAVGPRGQQGPQGLPGITGPEGPQGAIGPKGDQGLPGPQGPQGPAGEKGQQGDKGQTGAAGAPGAPGPQGPQGATGKRGSRSFNLQTTGTVWDGVVAKNAYNQQGYTTVEPYDIVTIFNPAIGFTEERVYNQQIAGDPALSSTFALDKWTLVSRVENFTVKVLNGVTADKLTIGSASRVLNCPVTNWVGTTTSGAYTKWVGTITIPEAVNSIMMTLYLNAVMVGYTEQTATVRLYDGTTLLQQFTAGTLPKSIIAGEEVSGSIASVTFAVAIPNPFPNKALRVELERVSLGLTFTGFGRPSSAQAIGMLA